MRSTFAPLATCSLLGLSLSGCFGLQNNVTSETGVFGDSGMSAALADSATPTTVALSGKLYVIAPADLNLVDPAGLNDLFHAALKDNVLVYVAQESQTSLTLDLSLAGSDGKQNPCEKVRTLPTAQWENPTFVAGPGEMDVSFAGTPATLRHLTVSGTFDQYAFNWRDGSLTAQLDGRELSSALGGADACTLVANAGGSCEACDDGVVACVTLTFAGVVASQSNDSYDTSPTCQ